MVRRAGGKADSYRSLSHQPATVQVLERVEKSFDEVVAASSNTTAGRSVAQDHPGALAITNRIVADHHGLDVVLRTAAGTVPPGR